MRIIWREILICGSFLGNSGGMTPCSFQIRDGNVHYLDRKVLSVLVVRNVDISVALSL